MKNLNDTFFWVCFGNPKRPTLFLAMVGRGGHKSSTLFI